MENVTSDDVIFITGGGNIGSLWLNIEDYITKIIADYKENKIFIFPQSLYFENSKFGDKEKNFFCKVVKEHGNVFIAARDKSSFVMVETALGQNIQVEYRPDMALFLPIEKCVQAREGVLVCLRNDKESMGWEREGLERKLKLYTTDIARDGYFVAAAGERIEKGLYYVIYKKIGSYRSFALHGSMRYD